MRRHALRRAEKKDGKIDASGSLTFDQYQQCQTLQLTYSDSDDYRLVGIRIAVGRMQEGPERAAALKSLLAPDRLFVGKSGGNAAVFFFDAEGKPRIKMVVDAARNPKLQFLDSGGKVIQTLPDMASATKK